MIKLLGDLGKGLVHLLLVGSIAGIEVDLDALALQLIEHLFASLQIDAGNDDLVSCPAQCLCGCATNAAGCTSNNCSHNKTSIISKKLL